MRRNVYLVTGVVIVLSLVVACAPTAPQVVPIKPPIAAASPSPEAATAVVSKPAVAPTTAPAAPSPAPVATVKRGGTVRDVMKAMVDSLDPQLGTGRGNPFHTLLFDNLMGYKITDPKLKTFDAAPGLAESFTLVDPTTIDLKLRKGVKFHDGSDFNAAVAKWNLERSGTHPKSQIKTTVDSIKSMQIVDDYTLRLNLKAPSASLPLLLSPVNINMTGMVSKEAVEKMGDDAFGASPVGTGPMKLRQWVRDDRIVMEKVPGHWEKGEDGQPLPYLDGFTSRFIIDQTVALVELRTGNVDLFPDLEPKDVAAVKADPNLMVTEKVGDEAWMGYPGSYFNPKRDYAFSNRKLREAAQYAIDHESMAQALGFGIGVAAYYPHWFPGMLGYDESLPRRVFDLQKSKSLMTEAGFPDGVDVEVSVINRPLDAKPLEALQAMWAKANIRLKITLVDRLPWIDLGRANKFDILSFSFKSRVDPQLAQYSRTGSGSNYPNYSNPDVDKLWEQADKEYDTGKRSQVYKDIQKIMFEDAYHMVGYMYPAPAAISKKVHDFTGPFGDRYIWRD